MCCVECTLDTPLSFYFCVILAGAIGLNVRMLLDAVGPRRGKM